MKRIQAMKLVPVALSLALAAVGLPSTLKPLHLNRAGHHAAGLWLASHAGPDDEIIDPFAWAHFYAGGVFREVKDAPTSERRVCYVVIEQSENDHSRLGTLPMARELAAR